MEDRERKDCSRCGHHVTWYGPHCPQYRVYLPSPDPAQLISSHGQFQTRETTPRIAALPVKPYKRLTLARSSEDSPGLRHRVHSLSVSTPSKYLFPMLLLLFALLRPQTCFAHALPTYTIPEANFSGSGSGGGSVGSNSRSGPSPHNVNFPPSRFRGFQAAEEQAKRVAEYSLAKLTTVPAPLQLQAGPPQQAGQKKKVKWPSKVKIGVLLPRFLDFPDPMFRSLYSMEYNLPALECAVEEVTFTRRLIPPTKVKVSIVTPSRPLKFYTHAPLEAFEMTYDGTTNVLFGPYGTWPELQINRYAVKWNIPVLTTGALLFPPKNPFLMSTRVQGTFHKLSKAAEEFIRRLGFNVIGFIYEYIAGTGKVQRDQPYSFILRPIFASFVTESFDPPHDTIWPGADFEQTLLNMRDHARIIVLCASQESVREIMIKAHELNFDNGEYVFFNIDLFSSHNATLKPWKRADDTPARNEAARKAYESLMTVTLRKPTGPEYTQFSEDVKVKAAKIYPNFTYGEEEVNSFVGAFYDAVILYATALNETIEAGGNVTDGIEITRRMWNRTFDGITGKVSIDDNGDRNADYSLLDMDPRTGEFHVVAEYNGATQNYSRIGDIHWPGGRKGPPPDTPKCGFDGSKCPPKEPLPAYIIVMIVLGSVLIVVVIVCIFVYRHIRLEAELNEMNWRVRWDDIMFGGPTKTGSGSDRKSEKQNSHRNSYTSDCSADTIAVHLSDVANKQLYTKTGYYKGAILAIKPIPRTHISMTKPLLMDIKKMKDLQNDHLVRFHGVCIDVPNQCILTEYCPKGSLQDVLENEQIKLDWMFRYSIMQDIVRGMTYLHSTDIKSHGHLKSSNCVVDSRFVVKITDFGLHYFKEKEEELEDDTYAIERNKLWMAPELLRMANPASCGTQKGDVYSFAIICQEIVYRNGAFYLQNHDLSPSEITDKIKKGMKPLFRPTLEDFQCPSDELAAVIRRCWAEEPADRPDFQGLRTMIKKLNKDGDKGDILDNLLTRMEQYANNLEALVEERTADYLQEKKKAEELLYNMLPRSVAHSLIRGESIKAEWFDSVTIYFSDICGFTALSAASSPMEVVDLLNDLYTVFDSIIDNFDVYKVETIGDAYMVVSGLPVKNGTLHAREIARMSLALLDSIFRFKIRHRPGEQIKLRIGIHSGPVCAGVVGLKMPRYCLFGDTVNTSSRMESNGMPLRIHVSPFTQEILLTFGTFHLEMRGPVEMKGKGVVTTYWLLGEENSPYNIQQQGNNMPTVSAASPIATVTPTSSVVTTSAVSPTSTEPKTSRKMSLKSLIH